MSSAALKDLLHSPEADVLFDEAIPPARREAEDAAIAACVQWLKGQPARVMETAPSVDERVVPLLSAPNVLRLMRMVAGSHPAVLGSAFMPLLCSHLRPLTAAKALGGFFQPAGLARIARVLAEEGDL